MHIDKLADRCHAIMIGENVLSKTTSQCYLGEILSSNGKIERKITERFNKGFGYVNQILTILKETSF